jgi:hypothetical protein
MTPEQAETVNFYKAYNVPATWFIGPPDTEGRIEVIALGQDFIWSLLIDAGGLANTSEATVGPFSTGIEV